MSDKPFGLALLFTGHMIDLPGRDEPRFPQHLQDAARQAIHGRIEGARQRAKGGSIVAIASGARGGDLLFHDACRLIGLERRIMVLPFPPKEFVESSVIGVPNGGWEAMFWDNWDARSGVTQEIILPHKDSSGYALCNQRMVALAKSLADSYEIIALWDGKTGDGPGGTAEHVEEIRRAGGRVEIIDTKRLLAGQAG